MVGVKELHTQLAYGTMQAGGVSMYPDENKVVKSFRIQPSLWEKFEAKAKADGVNARELLNMIIASYVNGDLQIGWSIRRH